MTFSANYEALSDVPSLMTRVSTGEPSPNPPYNTGTICRMRQSVGWMNRLSLNFWGRNTLRGETTDWKPIPGTPLHINVTSPGVMNVPRIVRIRGCPANN
jgi:hypothetical protein